MGVTREQGKGIQEEELFGAKGHRPEAAHKIEVVGGEAEVCRSAETYRQEANHARHYDNKHSACQQEPIISQETVIEQPLQIEGGTAAAYTTAHNERSKWV